MKRLTYFRLILVSITGALVLSLLSLYCLVRISDMVIDDYRYGYLLYMAKRMEKAVIKKPFAKLNLSQYLVAPASPNNTLSLLEASTEFGTTDKKEGHQQPPTLWVVDQNGKVISSNSINKELPMKWEDLPKPGKVHSIKSTRIRMFKPKTFIMRLNTPVDYYLVSYNPKSLFHGPFLWLQGIHTFITAAMTVFFALTISFFYMQRKSNKARTVMAQLASGDMKARFEVKRFDEFGSLILDFNRMADEIEKLVGKVKDIESSRSHLLQELGHDVRTPLTSLRTTFETLRDFHQQLSGEEKQEIFQMMGSDIAYFQDLLEKLTIVATIDVPRYKTSTGKVNLDELLTNELQNRQTGSNLQWSLVSTQDTPSLLLGDAHLLLRLFKNAFDNASRYANQAVQVTLNSFHDRVEVVVQDDGPGLTPEALQSFGKRRERRQVKERDSANFSLGLGSVIMKAIAEVHDGMVIMENRPDSITAGASLKITFRRI